MNRYVDHCKERIGDDIQKFEIEINGEVPVKKRAQLYDKEDTEDLAKTIKERKGLIYTVFGGKGTSRSKPASNSRMNTDVQKFYKQLIYKEKRLVNQTLLHVNSPKPKGNSLVNGRELFPRVGDY